RPAGKTAFWPTDQALRERRRLITTPAPNSANTTLPGSGTVSISYVSKRRVAVPLLASWSEYSPKAVTLSPGRGDVKVLPSTRVVPGVKLKESQALAAVVQL